jgi:hypothetical protein
MPLTLRNVVLIVGPNSLVFLTVIVWLSTALSLKKHRVPTPFWIELIAVTVFLPQLRNWWLSVGYLPRPLLVGHSLYGRLGLALLPALIAVPGAFLWRRLPGYILSIAGIVNSALLYVMMRYYVQMIA